MAGIEFRVDATLGDVSAVQSLINQVNQGATLNINTSQASQRIQQLQQQVNSLRQSLSGINVNIGGANGLNLNGLNGTVNSARQLQQAMQNVGVQMERVRTVNGQWDAVTQRVGDRYSNITQTLTANNNLTETATTNYQRLQADMDNFYKSNLNGIDFEIQKREMASQKFSQQIKEQMQLQAQQQQQLNALGMNTGSTINSSSIKDIESLKTALQATSIGFDSNTTSIKSFSQQVDSAGNTITKFTTRQKSVENGVEVWKDTSYAVSDVDNAVRQYGQNQTQVLNTQKSLMTSLVDTFKSYATYAVAMTVWNGITESIANCVNYAKDLDSAMTNIRVVTMDTKEATQDLLDSYNQMGQELGASTTEIASGAVDWLRQGYSQADTTELVRASTVLSQLAMIDNAEATEYLTSALKGYKLEAEDAMGVVDQLTAIDLEAATSAGDMAEAMSRTANMARTTGIEMNELLGMIATTAEVTQNSASTVGNSIKTVLSRMSNVKAGAEVDEYGESLNDVESVLNKVGIALRTNDGEWRDFYDVLDEVANRWESFTGTQQAQITTALGGTRQRENILVMLENWDKVQQYAQTGADSAGTAMEKYGIILESVEAKQAQLTAKVEEFQSNLMNGDMIAGLLEIGKAFMDIMNIGDGAVGKILLLTTSMVALNVALNALKDSKVASVFSNMTSWFSNLGTQIVSLITGTTTLSGALQALNINPVILGITALTTALIAGQAIFDYFNVTLEEQHEKAQQAQSEYQQVASELETVNAELQTTQERIDELNGKETLSITEQEELERLQQINAELEKRQYWLEIEAKRKQEEANEEASKAWDKDFNQQNEYTSRYDGTKKTIDYHGVTTEYTEYDKITEAEYIQEQIQYYGELQQEIDTLVAKEGQWTEEEKTRYESLKKTQGEVRDYLEETGTRIQTDYLDSYEVSDDVRQSWIDLQDKIQQALEMPTGTAEQTTESMNDLAKTFAEKFTDAGQQSKKAIQEVADYLSTLSEAELYRAGSIITNFDISNLDELKSYMQAYEDVDEALNGVANGFMKATEAKNEFEQAMSSIVEYDDNFDSYTSAVETLQEEFDNGTVGSKKFATACKYLFGESFDVSNVEEAEERLEKISEIFEDGTYGKGMLEQLSEIESKFWDLEYLGDGVWDIKDIDTSEEGIRAMSETLGITEEGVWSCLEALQMLGSVEVFDTEGIEDFVTQFKMVEEVTTSSGEKLQTINVDQLRDTLSKAGINADYLGEAIQGLAEKGYVLLDVEANGQQLATTLNTLGIVAQNGEVNVGNLVDTLNSMGYSKEAIQQVIDTLKETDEVQIDDKTVTLTLTGEEEANEKLGSVKESEDEVTDNPAVATVEVEGADEALSAIGNVDSALSALDGTVATTYINTVETTSTADTGDSELNGVGNNFSGTSHLNGTAFTRGSWGAKRSENALISEVAPEIWVHADTGKWELVTNPQFVRVKKGDVIFNAKQTADLLGKGSSLSFGSSFLNGTAFYSGTIGGWKKRDDEDYDYDYDYDYDDYDYDYDDYDYDYDDYDYDDDSSSDSSSEKEWWETELETLKDNLDYNVITMDSYINGLRELLNQLSEGTEAWKEVNKELQEAKLDNIENQFKRGEITIDTYIKKLADLRSAYKVNTEEYKELTQTINEAKADKFADQYKRGEISISSYIDQLTTLRDSYTKNSEEWKKYNDLIKETYLDKLNEKFENGEITLASYIKGLQKLRDTYNKNSEEYKKLDKEIKDNKADYYADKYQRGEISLKSYIKQLQKLRNSYAKNSEEWKKYNDLIKESKLDKVNQQFENGEITLASYIKKLKDLRDTYNKNSEDYKQLDKEIKDNKANYYADKYERGEISLKKYIKELTKLRDSYAKNSEEWKKYEDTIRQSKLDDYFKKLTESIEKSERAISKLGNVNTDKERVEYARLLSNEYKKIQNYINETKSKLENPDLTEDERTQLQEELNELLQKEVDIRDEIEDAIREYYENQKEQLKQQAELTRKEVLYRKELDLYGEKGKELWEYENDKKIKALQEQVDARNAEKEALDEINEREELENNLLKAKLNLQNALNNKTTKILTKQADGTWAYTFSANMADVQNARDEVDSAQKALDDFDWEQETKELEKQIDELNKNAEELSEQYEDAEFWADREYEQTINTIEALFGDIDSLVENWMEDNGENTKELLTAYQQVVKSNNSLIDSLAKLATQLESSYETVGNNGTIQGVVRSVISQLSAFITPQSFDTGGEISGSGLALVHNKERVLTQQQNANFMQLLDNIESANKLIDVSKVNIQSYRHLGNTGIDDKASQTVINSVSCSFPSITTTDGLQQAILELPRIARQQK